MSDTDIPPVSATSAATSMDDATKHKPLYLKQCPSQLLNFTGRTQEYFGIWFVNLVLTVLTLGIYGAWAKVRRLKYFYGNMYVWGSPLAYHATGLQIFIGRLILFGAVMLFYLATIFLFPVLAENNPTLIILVVVGFYILFLVAIPWLLNRSLRFQARVTSWRTVHFNWHGGYRATAARILVGPLIKVFSLTLLAPVVDRWTSNYIFGSYLIGNSQTSADMRLKNLYLGHVFSTLAFLLTAIGIMALGWGFMSDRLSNSERMLAAAAEPITLELISISFYIPLVVYYIIYSSYLTRERLNGLSLVNYAALSSNLSVSRLIWIKFSNLGVTLLSLGFLKPWADIRYARYLAMTTKIYVVDEGALFDTLKSSGTALGEEFADSEGYDFGSF